MEGPKEWRRGDGKTGKTVRITRAGVGSFPVMSKQAKVRTEQDN